MQIAFGAPVVGADGKQVGDVDALVVDSGTKRAKGMYIGGGLFGGPRRLIELSALTLADDHGIHLDESRAAADAEAEPFGEREVALGQRVPGPTEYIPAAGVGGPIVADPPEGPGQYPDDSSFFELAPIDPPAVEIQSNLDENEVVLNRGTSVISSDHHKLGEAVAFDLGDMGTIDAVMVSEGFVFKHTISVPLVAITEFDNDAVHLRLTRADAQAGR